MNRMIPKAIAFVTATAFLAGCSTAPTITVPNPLAALNSAFTAPATASLPSYTTQSVVPASTPTYIVDQPATLGSTYGIQAPTSYSVAAPTSYGIQTPTNYSVAAPTSYGVQAPTSYSVAAPTNYGIAAPTSYGVQAPSASYGQLLPVQASAPQINVPTFGTAPSATGSYGINVPSAQVLNPVSTGSAFPSIPSASSALGGGVATYQPVTSVPTSVSLPGGATLSY